MFDVGWSELIVIAVVALIAIGPKELPGVLRMVGQWMAKIRRMAADFQGQFNEAMREAEMADIKKQFDEIKDTAKSFTGADLLGDVQKDFDDALKLEDKPDDKAGATTPEDKPAAGAPAAEGTPAVAEPSASEAAASEAIGSEATETKPDQPQAAATPDAAAASGPEPAPEPAVPANVSPDPAVEPAAAAPDKPAPAAPPQAETGAAKAS